MFLTGRGLADVDRAALGGRPIVIDEAEHERLRLRIPDDAPAGATWITLIAGGQPLEPFPIVIGGLNGRLDAGRRFPPRPMADAGPSPIDGGTVADAGPPDAGAPLLAEFSPDPGGDVRLEAIDSPEGQLKLRVIYPPDGSDRWGIALHLAYDRNLMRLIESTPPNSDRFATAEAGPGRTVLGGLLTEDPVVAELTFALIGRGEGRVDLPTRHRQVRGSGNRPRSEVTWAGGSVRVQEVAP